MEICSCLFPYKILLLYIITANSAEDIGFFWQLTDIHLDLNYSAHCSENLSDPRCDSSSKLFQLALNATQKFSPTSRLDFVIWSGDNGPHVENITASQLLEHIEVVSASLKTVFPTDRIYILPTVGNHDVQPANEMSPNVNDTNRLSWCRNLATNPKLWAPWINRFSTRSLMPSTVPPWANFSTGCFHSHLLPERKLLLVGLNSLIWYKNNRLARNAGSDPLGQLTWLNETLLWAREMHYKVLLVSHFPPGASENAPRRFEFLWNEINDAFVHILQEFRDVLMAGLFGHEHVDSFRVLYDEIDRPAVSLFLAPSISPMRLAGLGSFNPRIRLYQYKRSTGSIMGYKQYFLDLESTPISDWKLEYDTNTAYQLQDLSPNSLAWLLGQLACDETADGPWATYWKHELGGRPHELWPDGLCPRTISLCRCEHICAMRFVLLPELHRCLLRCAVSSGSSPFLCHPSPSSKDSSVQSLSINISGINETSGIVSSSKRSSLPIIIGVIIAFLVILVGVVLLVNREICQKRGRYGSRFGTGGSSIGGVIFSTLNGSFPRSVGLNGLGGSHAQCGDSIAGSCTELRVAFQPHYNMEDDISVITQGTIDPNDHSHYVVSNCHQSTDNKKQLLQIPSQRLVKSQRRVNGHLAVGRLQGSHFPRDNRYSAAELTRTRDSNAAQLPAEIEAVVHQTSTATVAQSAEHNSMLHPNSDMRTLPSTTASKSSCPAEDYYADDEQAFGDDELEEESESEILYDQTNLGAGFNDEHTSSTDSGPFDDGEKPIYNAPMRLTNTRSIKDWSSVGKRNSIWRNNRRSSVEDPSSLNPNHRFSQLSEPPTEAASHIMHSQSVTGSLDTQRVHSHLVSTLSDAQKGAVHLSCRTDPGEQAQPLTNGAPTESTARSNDLNGTSDVHQPVTYDYVRI